MDTILDFINENSVVFITVGVVLVLALIGFIGEKVRDKDKVSKKKEPKETIEKTEEPKIEEKPIEEVAEPVEEFANNPLENDPVYGTAAQEGTNSFTMGGFEPQSGVSDDLFAPLNGEEKTEEPKEEFVAGGFEPQSGTNEDLYAPLNAEAPVVELPEEPVVEIPEEPAVDQVNEETVVEKVEEPTNELPKEEPTKNPFETSGFQFFAPTEEQVKPEENEISDRF